MAAAADLTPDEAVIVRDTMQAQQDVAPGALLAYEKYLLREYYGWHGRPLDADFVAAYASPDARRVYRNLRRITEGETLLDSLKLMRAQEAHHYAYVMETRVEGAGFINESRDLLRDRSTYVFQAHFLAVWLLRVCGFRCVTDKAHVSDAGLEARLRAALPLLRKSVPRMVSEYEIARPNVDRLEREPDRGRFLAAALRTVNAVVRTAYGVSVVRVSKRAGGAAYYLNQSAVGRLFVFRPDPEPDDTPGGPRPHIPSRLRELSAASNRVTLFLEETFYARPAAAEAAEAAKAADPAPADLVPVPAEAPKHATMPAGRVIVVSEAALDEFLAEQFAMAC